MKYVNFKKLLALLVIITFSFSACKKVKTPKPMGDAGQTLVKILGGATPYAIVAKPIDFVNTPTKILAVEVRRDVPSNAELNKTMTVTVKDDLAAVMAANPAYIQFPPAWFIYDLEGGTKAGGQGGTFTFTFKPGEFSKSLWVIIPDATLLNPSALYGLGFTLLTADAGGTITAQKSVVVEIGAKNIYDGIYKYVSGLVTRYTAPGVPETSASANWLLNGPLGPGNDDVIMSTIGASTVAIPTSGENGRITWSYLTTPNSGVAGIDGIKITVDPVTNLATALCSGYGANSNATFGNWLGHTNKYDPLTKTFTLAWRWNPTSTTREYECVLKYDRPR